MPDDSPRPDKRKWSDIPVSDQERFLDAINAPSYPDLPAAEAALAKLAHYTNPKDERSLPSYFMELEAEWQKKLDEDGKPKHRIYIEAVNEQARNKLIEANNKIIRIGEIWREAQALVDEVVPKGIDPAGILQKTSYEKRVRAITGEGGLVQAMMELENVREILMETVNTYRMKLEEGLESRTPWEVHEHEEGLLEDLEEHGEEAVQEGQRKRNRHNTEWQAGAELLGARLDARPITEGLMRFTWQLQDKLESRLKGATPA